MHRDVCNMPQRHHLAVAVLAFRVNFLRKLHKLRLPNRQAGKVRPLR
jgi:hypothetical protein